MLIRISIVSSSRQHKSYEDIDVMRIYQDQALVCRLCKVKQAL